MSEPLVNTSSSLCGNTKAIRSHLRFPNHIDDVDRDSDEDIDDADDLDDAQASDEQSSEDEEKQEIDSDSDSDELVIDSEADDYPCDHDDIDDNNNHNNGEDADDEHDDCCCCNCDQSQMSCCSLSCNDCSNCGPSSECELCINSGNDNLDSQIERSQDQLDDDQDFDDASSTSSISQHLVKHWMKIGKSVFVRWTDGLYYLGKIERIKSSFGLCLVHYEDDSLYWTHFKDIHTQLSPNSIESDADIICNECGDGSSKSPNEIVICDVCNQGYHQLCHKPPIPDSILEPDIPWTCRTCVFTLAARVGGAEKDSPIGEAMKLAKVMFHYDIESLSWNDSHTSNRENIYCYCGGPGRYHSRMLQCHKCLQWFHEACIQVIESPLLYGDHFYQFTCAVCNQGEEVIRRVTMKWQDLLSIVLYNLTLRHGRRFSDFQSEILPFIQKNASKFKMKCNLQKTKEDELSRKILQVLMKYRKRFASCKDVRKKADFWSLRLTHQSSSKPLILFPRSRTHKSSKQEKAPPSLAISTTSQQRESPPHHRQTPSPSSQRLSQIQHVRSQSPPSFPLIFGACRKGASVYPKPAMRRSNKTKDEKILPSNYSSCGDNMSICTPGTSSFKPNIKLKIRSKVCNDKSRHPKRHRSSTNDDGLCRTSPSSQNPQEASHHSVNSPHRYSHSSSDTSETETVPTVDTILEEVIPLPENFEGQNNPFFDMDQKVVSKGKNNSFADPSAENPPLLPPQSEGNVGFSQKRGTKSCIDNAAPKTHQESGGYQVIRSGTCSKLTLKRIPCNLLDKGSHDIWTSSSVAESIQKGANSRKCIIKAQRFTTDGKLEYLLEWE